MSKKHQKIRIMLMGGHEYGLQMLWAFFGWETLFKFCQVDWIWADWSDKDLKANNFSRRFLRFDPNPQEAMRWMYRDAISYGFPESRIIQQPYDGDLHRKIVSGKRVTFYGGLNGTKKFTTQCRPVEAIALTTYGKAITEEVIRLVSPSGEIEDSNFIIAHPTEPFTDNLEHLREEAKRQKEVVRLPKTSRGASVIEHIVERANSPNAKAERFSLQQALIRGAPVNRPSCPEEWDSGELLALSPTFRGPRFRANVDGSWPTLAQRVIETQRYTAVEVAILFRYKFLREIVSPEHLFAVEPEYHEVEKQGYDTKDLRDVGYKIPGYRHKKPK